MLKDRENYEIIFKAVWSEC